MAYIPAGIFGAGRGKVAGTVLSEARTLWGKMGTVREYTIPVDPKTEDQLKQREKFRVAGVEAGMFGAGFYQRAWNNGLGLNAGYQSLVSYLLGQLKEAGDSWNWKLSLAPKTLGPVYNGAIAPAVAGASGKVKITWDTSIVGDYCAATDPLTLVIAHETEMCNQLPSYFKAVPAAAVRSAGLYESATQFIPGDNYWVFAVFENYTGGVWRSSTMQPVLATAKA